jgi:hypothetical protein
MTFLVVTFAISQKLFWKKNIILQVSRLIEKSCQIWQYSEFSQIEEKYTALMAVTFFSTF